jgi:hypothetical protein
MKKGAMLRIDIEGPIESRVALQWLITCWHAPGRLNDGGPRSQAV